MTMVWKIPNLWSYAKQRKEGYARFSVNSWSPKWSWWIISRRWEEVTDYLASNFMLRYWYGTYRYDIHYWPSLLWNNFTKETAVSHFFAPIRFSSSANILNIYRMDTSSAERTSRDHDTQMVSVRKETLSAVLESLRAVADMNFVCAICFESCTDPHKFTQCLHQFCGKCIRDSIAKWQKRCPICKTNIISRRDLRQDSKLGNTVRFTIAWCYMLSRFEVDFSICGCWPYSQLFIHIHSLFCFPIFNFFLDYV